MPPSAAAPSSPPVSLKSFDEANRRVLGASRSLREEDESIWQQGRDWLTRRALSTEVGRASPRAPIAVTAYLGGVGEAVTENLSFDGVALCAPGAAALTPGTQARVRLHIRGKSLEASGAVVWSARSRVGIRFDPLPPEAGRTVEAAVLSQLLARWR